jgi:hypothetical protein
MWRTGAVCLSIILVAQSPAATGRELHNAVQSPYLVKQYIENHDHEESEPKALFHALGIKIPRWDDGRALQYRGLQG